MGTVTHVVSNKCTHSSNNYRHHLHPPTLVFSSLLCPPVQWSCPRPGVCTPTWRPRSSDHWPAACSRQSRSPEHWRRWGQTGRRMSVTSNKYCNVYSRAEGIKLFLEFHHFACFIQCTYMCRFRKSLYGNSSFTKKSENPLQKVSNLL